MREPGGELLLVIGQAGSVFYNFRDRRIVKVFEVGFLAQFADERGILPGILLVTIHDRVKLGLDFEEF